MPVSRRSLLTGIGQAVAVLAATPAAAAMPFGRDRPASGPPLEIIGGRMRPPPPLPKLADVAGLIADNLLLSRDLAHRSAGVRLETEAYQAAGETKFVVHNYGHGSAAVTLAWGCAVDVAASVRQIVATQTSKREPRIAVIGAGIIGLTSAYELSQTFRGAQITVYSKDVDGAEPDVTKSSAWVLNGLIEPPVNVDDDVCANRASLARHVAATTRRIEKLERTRMWGTLGIEPRASFTPLTQLNSGFERISPAPGYWQPQYGLLPFTGMANDAGQVRGARYQTWLMNPRIALPALVGELKQGRVAFRNSEFRTRSDVLALREDIIVNCSGLGARSLFADASLRTVGAYLAVVSAPIRPDCDYGFSVGRGPNATGFVVRQDGMVISGADWESGARSLGERQIFTDDLIRLHAMLAGRSDRARQKATLYSS